MSCEPRGAHPSGKDCARPRCGYPAYAGDVRSEPECRVHFRQWQREARRDKRRRGLCECGADPDPGYVRCGPCRAKIAAHQRRWRYNHKRRLHARRRA